MTREKRQALLGCWYGLLSVVFLCAVFVAAPARAEDAPAAIAQGFTMNGEQTPGAIVSFADGSKSGNVKLANSASAEKLAGVISQKPLVELSGGEEQAQVVISGMALVLVSDVNGTMKYGDKIAPSPVSGVGMKATASGLVLGTAAGDFSAIQQVAERKIRNKDGVEQTVKIGLLPVQINVSYYQAPDDDRSILPPFLQQFINTVAGKPVGLIRSIIALLLLVAGLGGIAVLIYASVRSSIISIGRNPLSAPAVHRSLLEVGAIAVGVLLVVVIAVYLVLAI